MGRGNSSKGAAANPGLAPWLDHSVYDDDAEQCQRMVGDFVDAVADMTNEVIDPWADMTAEVFPWNPQEAFVKDEACVKEEEFANPVAAKAAWGDGLCEECFLALPQLHAGRGQWKSSVYCAACWGAWAWNIPASRPACA